MRVHHKLEVKKISKIIDNGSDIKIVYTTDVLMKYRMIIHIPNTTSCEEFRGHARDSIHPSAAPFEFTAKIQGILFICLCVGMLGLSEEDRDNGSLP